MKVTILSLSKAQSYQTDKIASVIRIGDSDRDFPPLLHNFQHTCQLKFYDIEPKPLLPSNWNWFMEKEGKILLDFFETIKDSEELVIHCHVGFSRSPAVALAYAWYTQDEKLESMILKDSFAPNAQVLKVMAKMIGVYEVKFDYIESCSRL